MTRFYTLFQQGKGAQESARAVQREFIASSRFLQPAYLGDTLHPSLTVEELKPQRTTGLLILRSELRNQHGEMVLEGRHTYLIKRCHPEGSD